MTRIGLSDLATTTPVDVAAGVARLAGELTLPPHAKGVVLFAHGSGSSRASPRNIFVARTLHVASIGTLLFDLLTPYEDRTYATRFDIPLLTTRLLAATEWLASRLATPRLRLAYFGASTGAAAALAAAAERSDHLAAVVSRGGRPDLAGDEVLRGVSAPTLLIVGGLDTEVLALNRSAYALMTCEKSLQVVAGATHLFEEPGTLEAVAKLASDWFSRWFDSA